MPNPRIRRFSSPPLDEDTLNIFATSMSPVASAQALDDKRVGSQLRESAQLLSASSHYTGRKPYRIPNENHPAVAWVNAHPMNTDWLAAHAMALDQEWTHRYGTRHGTAHATGQFIFPASLTIPQHFEPYNGAKRSSLDIDFTQRDDIDVYERYRLYLNVRWQLAHHAPKWTNRTPPHWANYTRQPHKRAPDHEADTDHDINAANLWTLDK